MTFLDTSAVGRLLVAGPGSAEIGALFRDPGPIAGSALVVVELLRIATRNQLDYASAERAIRRMRLLAVDDSVLREAGRLHVTGTWIRSADAVHLVSATRLGERAFVTYDRVQARGAHAHALGLDVSSPGMAPDWWR